MRIRFGLGAILSLILFTLVHTCVFSFGGKESVGLLANLVATTLVAVGLSTLHIMMVRNVSFNNIISYIFFIFGAVVLEIDIVSLLSYLPIPHILQSLLAFCTVSTIGASAWSYHYSVTHGSTKLRNITITILSGVFIILACVALYIGWHHMNPDGLSYYKVAEHYAHGHYKAAVNAYWSPLISWLLVPFIWLGITAETGFRICMMVFSIVILCGQYYFMKRVFSKKHSSYTNMIVMTSMIMTALFIFQVLRSGLVTPDLLCVAWSVWFAVVVVEIVYKLLQNKDIDYRRSLILGLMIVVGFYIKGFLLPFSVVCLVGLCVLALYKNINDRDHLYKYIRSLAVCIVVVLLLTIPWVGLLHHKYERWMLGSASKFNMSWDSPNPIKPTVDNGLFPPANKYANNSWEDVTDRNYPKWSPLESASAMQYHIFHNFNRTSHKIITVISQWSPVTIAVLLSGYIILMFTRKTKKLTRDKRVVSLLVIGAMAVIYLGGYSVVHLVGGERYIWSVLLFLIVAAGTLTAYLSDEMKRYSRQITWIALACCLFFVGYYINGQSTTQFSTSPPKWHNQDIAKSVRAIIPEGSKVAGNKLSPNYYVSYLLNLKSYGTIPPGKSLADASVRRDIDRFGIKYFFCNNLHTNCGANSDDSVVWKSKADNVVIFDVKSASNSR